MEWTCEKIEDTLNYMRVVLGAEKISMFSLDNDRIGYWASDGLCHQKSFRRIYEEMLDKQQKI